MLETDRNPASEKAPELKSLLARPLITGASVSADWSSFSPAKKAALRVTPAKNIRMIAFGGTPGIRIWPRVRGEDLVDRTLIAAVDFFFWDSTLPSPTESIETLHDLVGCARKLEVPLVLGEIPELLPGRQPNRARLNREIADAASTSPLVRVMPFDRIHREILRTGAIHYRGRAHSLRELVPDGLHLSEVAGDYLADQFESLFLRPF